MPDGLHPMKAFAQPDAARAFVAARLANTALPAYPAPLPASLAAAYAIQQAAIALWPDRVAGWKVGLVQPPNDARIGQNRLFGPIFAANVRLAGSDPLPFAAIRGGFAAVEAEYVLKLGETVPPATGWTTETAAGTVAAVHIGVELAGSPFPGINDHGPLVTISDFGNNAGLLLGPEIAGGLAGLGAEICTMQIDGTSVGQGSPAAIPGGPLESLAALLNHMGRAGQVVAAGTLVSTGAATGVHEIRAGQSAVAGFGAAGSIRVLVTEAAPC